MGQQPRYNIPAGIEGMVRQAIHVTGIRTAATSDCPEPAEGTHGL
jgi:hypothetical protein